MGQHRSRFECTCRVANELEDRCRDADLHEVRTTDEHVLSDFERACSWRERVRVRGHGHGSLTRRVLEVVGAQEHDHRVDLCCV